MAQTVYAVTCKADGSVIALYTTRALAEARLARAFRAYALQITVMNVLDSDM